MAKSEALLFHHFLTIFIIAVSFSCKASDDDKQVYIVYMGALPEGIYSPNSHHFDILESVLKESSVSSSLIYSYKRSFNGFVARLSDKEKQKLASKKEVVSIFPRQVFHTQTTRSWDFTGLSETITRNPTVESDTIIGVIDTGIWPESESFSNVGLGPPPKKWKGACKGGKRFACNNKLIGARFYNLIMGDIFSARDDVSHGTHTASTAAGRYVRDASFYEIAKGTARGGVPSARIAAYKVCDYSECYSDYILAAFDDAIADGVDIITISIGSGMAIGFDRDTIAIGASHAMENGILILNSAGNSGPSLGTVTSLAPWMMTVAANSTDRRIIDKVVLGNGTTISGRSVNSFKMNGITFPLIYGRNAPAPRCSVVMAGNCEDQCLDSDLVKGKIVLCDSFSGFDTPLRAGALGSILITGEFSDVSSVVPFPATALSHSNYKAILQYLESTNVPQATILKSEEIKDPSAPRVASFSSRGPNAIAPDILKPDISAPGVDILAAYIPVRAPSSAQFDDKRRVKYNTESGTSMACPHVAGAAAYVKTFHPDWSPSAIKSSLMTTAWVMKNTNTSNREFDYGSGHINPVQAINPGLVYEASEDDYIKLLCSIGYNDTKVGLVSGGNSSCPEGSNKGSPKDLNYPTMTAKVSEAAFRVEFRRRVENVGLANSTYKASIFPKPAFDIKVVPAVLSFASLNEEKSFDVIINGGGLSNNSMVSASLVWSDGSHNVRSPIVVHNIQVMPS